MIRSPIGLRILSESQKSLRSMLELAARGGARGVVLDAAGELAPHRIGETGRRELRGILRTMELTLIAMHLPTRRPFDTDEDLDDRLRRAERAFALTYELGGRMALVSAGPVAPDPQDARRDRLRHALRELADRADRQGVRLALESGGEPAARLAAVVRDIDHPMLAVSVDPSASAAIGDDPAEVVRAFAGVVAHAYAARGTPAGRSTLSLPGRRAAAIQWEELLGALEEINYRGFLTVRPDSAEDAEATLREFVELFKRF